MNFTRGFRSRGPRDPRLPPGQYDVGSDWPVLTAEATPTLPTEDWTFSVEGLVERRPSGRGRRCRRCRIRPTRATSTASPPGRSSASPSGACRSTPCWRPPDRCHRQLRAGHLPHRVHHQPAPGRRDRGQGLGGWEFEGEPLARVARGAGPSARAPPLLLEECQVGLRARAAGPRRAGVLGAERLSRPRRPLARAALPR